MNGPLYIEEWCIREEIWGARAAHEQLTNAQRRADWDGKYAAIRGDDLPVTHVRRVPHMTNWSRDARAAGFRNPKSTLDR